MNQTKIAIYGITTFLIKHANNAIKQRNEFIFTQSPELTTYINKLIEVTINSLATFISSPKLTLDFVYLSATAKNFIFRQLKFLKACASGNAFIQTIHLFRSALFLDIILQFAACDPSELDTMATQPQEFVNYALDCITKQKSGVPKSEAIGLFEILCDN
jgi:hypothetical protein